jgi:hypothetical protein
LNKEGVTTLSHQAVDIPAVWSWSALFAIKSILILKFYLNKMNGFVRTYKWTSPFKMFSMVCVKVVMMNVIFIQLERSYQRFTAFYNNRHSGRKLGWLYQMSKGEIVTNCFKNRYTLQVISWNSCLVFTCLTCFI